MQDGIKQTGRAYPQKPDELQSTEIRAADSITNVSDSLIQARIAFETFLEQSQELLTPIVEYGLTIEVLRVKLKVFAEQFTGAGRERDRHSHVVRVGQRSHFLSGEFL
ncbi:hypothetical protein SAMN05446927_6548 [Caballeronia arationis]|jgi:hypothetical protein|uniref:Uncharacterized protein n=1 Tax=Caballeronia arationis TaxID=1777142 RepID=A0A7Z7N6D6_9BURK|nr:hypothetical protein SAMN05446927_6548 [Caballeronia arationis]